MLCMYKKKTYLICKLSIDSIDFGKSRQETEMMERYVRIKTEYESKMKVELNKARVFFKNKYVQFIGDLERKANEVCFFFYLPAV